MNIEVARGCVQLKCFFVRLGPILLTAHLHLEYIQYSENNWTIQFTKDQHQANNQGNQSR